MLWKQNEICIKGLKWSQNEPNELRENKSNKNNSAHIFPYESEKKTNRRGWALRREEKNDC